jgi:uncharacterized protein (TIGR03435 family)
MKRSTSRSGAMIRMAYRLQDYQIVGAPGWVDHDRFDIIGKAPSGDSRRTTESTSHLSEN